MDISAPESPILFPVSRQSEHTDGEDDPVADIDNMAPLNSMLMQAEAARLKADASETSVLVRSKRRRVSGDLGEGMHKRNRPDHFVSESERFDDVVDLGFCSITEGEMLFKLWASLRRTAR